MNRARAEEKNVLKKDNNKNVYKEVLNIYFLNLVFCKSLIYYPNNEKKVKNKIKIREYKKLAWKLLKSKMSFYNMSYWKHFQYSTFKKNIFLSSPEGGEKKKFFEVADIKSQDTPVRAGGLFIRGIY